MNKRCWICKKEKPVSEFNKNHCKKDGYASQCRDCMVNYHHLNEQKYRFDFDEFVRKMYKNIQERFKRGRRSYGPVVLSRDEFKNFVKSSYHLRLLYLNWQLSGWKNVYIPTVDRINNDIGYLPGNIQFLIKRDNLLKERARKGYFIRCDFFLSPFFPQNLIEAPKK